MGDNEMKKGGGYATSKEGTEKGKGFKNAYGYYEHSECWKMHWERSTRLKKNQDSYVHCPSAPSYATL